MGCAHQPPVQAHALVRARVVVVHAHRYRGAAAQAVDQLPTESLSETPNVLITSICGTAQASLQFASHSSPVVTAEKYIRNRKDKKVAPSKRTATCDSNLRTGNEQGFASAFASKPLR